MAQKKIFKELAAYGVASSEVLSLDRVDASTIDYLDIQRNWRRAGELNFVAPDAVVEIDGRPLMYVVRSTSLTRLSAEKQQGLVSLRRALACRGEASYIGIVEPGQITVVPNYYASDLSGAFTVLQDAPRAQLLIRDLAMEVRPPSVPEQQWKRNGKSADQLAVHQLLFDLLDRVTADLRTAGSLAGQDGEILSLVGRCLFTCFLIDRGIINEQTFPALYAAGADQAFSSPELAALTCKWLDSTFNGELLPLAHEDYPAYFANLVTPDGAVFNALSKIIQRTTPEGQYHLDCGWIDFSHVPVGLLSQVYESYAHKFFGDPATAESIHYTPRHIAEFMVDQAFDGLTTCEPEDARVLDPAAGAGVFLVICFRKLVKAFWKRHQRPPDTIEIRRILAKQIRGLDINEHALKLSALSLYLTAIELDANPLNGQSLLFDPLLGNVLFNTRHPDDLPAWKSMIRGSIGFNLSQIKVDRPFDLVIANPPWTQWGPTKNIKDPSEKKYLTKRADALNDEVSELIRGVAARRDAVQLADIATGFKNPLKVPDVPFVWCAMEWAAKNAVIAFALHARLLFRRAEKGASARETLFRALHVTGIVNGTAVRQEKVWPNVDAQFCLFFARNAIPSEKDAFYYLSPELEHDLNARSMWRIDYQSAQPIEFGVLAEHPYLIKTLFKGTALDADVVSRLISLTEPVSGSNVPRALQIADYWQKDRGLFSGQGLFTNSGKQNAQYLIDLKAKKLTAHDKANRYVDTSLLDTYKGPDKVLRARRHEIFRPPLVLFSQAPGAKEDSIPVRISLDDTVLAYNHSFYGYSTYGHPEAEAVAKYLFVIAQSMLLPYYTLMTSARYGIERDTVYVEDINDFPIIPFESLTKIQKSAVQRLADGLIEGSEGIQSKIDAWVAHLYGLTDHDVQVIIDTLSINMPTTRAKQRAQDKPTGEEISAFAQTMEAYLQPFFDLTDEQIRVAPKNGTPGAWQFLDVHVADATAEAGSPIIAPQVFEALADQEGASRVFARLSRRRLSIGLLAQYRYWTPSRAKLCAMDLLREHGTWLDGQER